jgi:hypothetical protein
MFPGLLDCPVKTGNDTGTGEAGAYSFTTEMSGASSFFMPTTW